MEKKHQLFNKAGKWINISWPIYMIRKAQGETVRLIPELVQNVTFDELAVLKKVKAWFDPDSKYVICDVKSMLTAKRIRDKWDETGVMYKLSAKGIFLTPTPSIMRIDIFNQEDCEYFKLIRV